jgi:hypothetical protein
MHLRVTIDSSYTIVAAQAAYDAHPFEICAAIAGAYAKLVGMNLLKGFRKQIKERFALTEGCTHMSELAMALPSAAVQANSDLRRAAARAQPEQRPMQIGRCHAFRTDGPVVKELYPLWYDTPISHPS